jgi:hypothetical protein
MKKCYQGGVGFGWKVLRVLLMLQAEAVAKEAVAAAHHLQWKSMLEMHSDLC